jgi:8-oxo-dGTP pyrophosphatase MutT (NUDIX family)
LILFAPLTPHQNDWHIILTRRTATLNGHSGQMSFPGGRRDPDDADFWQTALRETREELGIDTAEVQQLGHLTPLYIPPSHFDVYPWAGYLPVLPALNPSPYEVAAVHLTPVSALLEPASKTETDIPLPDGQLRTVPAYMLCGQIVWGATAIMLCELEHRLRTVMG